jgi:translation elongation factor EF-1beta
MPDDREREIQIQNLLGKIKSYPSHKIKYAVVKEKETATGLYEMYLDLILITGEI